MVHPLFTPNFSLLHNLIDIKTKGHFALTWSKLMIFFRILPPPPPYSLMQAPPLTITRQCPHQKWRLRGREGGQILDFPLFSEEGQHSLKMFTLCTACILYMLYIIHCTCIMPFYLICLIGDMGRDTTLPTLASPL